MLLYKLAFVSIALCALNSSRTLRNNLCLEKEPDRASYPTDLWSLGVSLFEMVSEVLPFQAESDLLFGVAVPAYSDALSRFLSLHSKEKDLREILAPR